MINWYKLASNKEIKEIEKKLNNMSMKDKLKILSLIDVDLDSYFANLIYQKTNFDEKLKKRINDLLNMPSQEEQTDVTEENNENLPDKLELSENVQPPKLEPLKEEKSSSEDKQEDKDKEVVHFKIKKDEFTTKANIDSPLAHERDTYSIWQDYGSHEGYTPYEPYEPEDYILEEIPYDEFKGNIKGVKYKIIWYKGDKNEKKE